MIRNYKLMGNDIVNADFKDRLVVGTFNEQLIREEKKKIVLDLVYGREMLEIYKSRRDSFHILDVVDMLKEMEKIFSEWDYKSFEASRQI